MVPYLILNDGYFSLNDTTKLGTYRTIFIGVAILRGYLFFDAKAYWTIIMHGQASDEITTVLFILFTLTTGLCCGYKYLKHKE